MKDYGYVLIETDDWFTGKDGQKYHAVWGYAKIRNAEGILGFKPSHSANWFIEVGIKDSMIIAGCKVHYIQECREKPSGNDVFCLE